MASSSCLLVVHVRQPSNLKMIFWIVKNAEKAIIGYALDLTTIPLNYIRKILINLGGVWHAQRNSVMIVIKYSLLTAWKAFAVINALSGIIFIALI